MKRTLHVRPLATADIDHAAAFLYDENPAAASAFLEAIEAAFDLLKEQPGVGSPRYAHLLPGVNLRMWPLRHFPHLIFFTWITAPCWKCFASFTAPVIFPPF